jgi:ferredoxin
MLSKTLRASSRFSAGRLASAASSIFSASPLSRSITTISVKPSPAVSLAARAHSTSADEEDLDPHGGFERLPAKRPEDKLTINVTDRNGKTHAVPCKVGDNLLFLCRILQEKTPELFLEGACEASLGCSTCHVIIDDDAFFASFPDPSEKEEDMLDLAACLTSTSRLACQLKLAKQHDGMGVTLPKFSRNFYVDGHIPQPH